MKMANGEFMAQCSEGTGQCSSASLQLLWQLLDKFIKLTTKEAALLTAPCREVPGAGRGASVAAAAAAPARAAGGGGPSRPSRSAAAPAGCAPASAPAPVHT